MEMNIGDTKNDWTVTGNPYRTKNGWYAVCTCSCGKEKPVNLGHLKAGRSKSCGHNNGKSRITHGMYGTPEYRTWKHMLERCRNPRCKSWPDYGGRGISVCPEWESFDSFYRDMGTRPPGTSLDRIDNNGGYCPENCRWATPTVQSRNVRTNIRLEYGGESLTISEWAERLGMEYLTLYSRVQTLGWSVERAIEEPATEWSERKHSESTLAKLRENTHAGLPVTCPHCGKSGGKTIMARWHFNRCKAA